MERIGNIVSLKLYKNMKKTIFLSILAIACMLIGFTSCDPKAK